MRRHMQLHPKPKCFVSKALSQKTNIVDVPAAWVSDGSVHRVCALVELPRVQNLFRLEQILLGRVDDGYRSHSYSCHGSTTDPAREPRRKHACSEHSEQPA